MLGLDILMQPILQQEVKLELVSEFFKCRSVHSTISPSVTPMHTGVQQIDDVVS